MSAPSGDGEPVGSLAEEAAKLLGVLSGLAGGHDAEDGPGPGAAGDSLWAELGGLGDAVGEAFGAVWHEVDQHVATGSAECRYCPVCAAIGLARRTSPEARQHLSQAATSFAAAAAAWLSTDVEGARRDHERERRGGPAGEADRYPDRHSE